MIEPKSSETGPRSSSSKRDPSPTAFRKPCTLCQTPRAVLVRCQIDEAGTWHFVCTGQCWRSVSGGAVDAVGHATEFPHYRYGGMWKNKHEGVSAKKRKSRSTNGVKEGVKSDGCVMMKEWTSGVEFTRNDRVREATAGVRWMCRRSHWSEETNGPTSAKAYRFWKEDDMRDTPEDVATVNTTERR